MPHPTVDAAPALALPLTEVNVRAYLASRFGPATRVIGLSSLAAPGAGELKGYGYGEPVKIEFEVMGQRRAAVLETITPGPFGHEHMADRAQNLLWSHQAYNRLPHHVRSIDVGGFQSDGTLVSVANINEFFILTEFVSGDGYYRDLERIRDDDALQDIDCVRADALCDYLVDIHRTRGHDPQLYVRRVRELVGGSECIAGILDTYPTAGDLTASGPALEALEHACVGWRWRLKPLVHRLRQIHGDFHPWNILFDAGDRFVVLDRSRGEWGDPADDVACLTMNYVFFALQRHGRLEGPLETLFTRFWQRYEHASGDQDLRAVVAPFLAFRALVMANPVWYPRLAVSVRRRLLALVRAVLAAPSFDPDRVNDYCDA